jgi:hypothetical protein
LLDELKLSQSGLLSADNSMRVGKMIGAKYLVFGGYIVTMDRKIRIDVRVVEVETGLTMKAGEVTGKVDRVLSLIKKLSRDLLKDIQVKLSREDEHRLRRGRDVEEGALLAFSDGVAHEDKHDYKSAVLFYKKAIQIDPDFKQAVERLKYLEKQGI